MNHQQISNNLVALVATSRPWTHPPPLPKAPGNRSPTLVTFVKASERIGLEKSPTHCVDFFGFWDITKGWRGAKVGTSQDKRQNGSHWKQSIIGRLCDSTSAHFGCPPFDLKKKKTANMSIYLLAFLQVPQNEEWWIWQEPAEKIFYILCLRRGVAALPSALSWWAFQLALLLSCFQTLEKQWTKDQYVLCILLKSFESCLVFICDVSNLDKTWTNDTLHSSSFLPWSCCQEHHSRFGKRRAETIPSSLILNILWFRTIISLS